MRTITDIYNEYKILPSLQMHMFRVAGVGLIISQSLEDSLTKDNTREIISTCLLHDMGNIIKFNFKVLPDLLEPEGVDYWSQIQLDFKNKYGEDEHLATLEIAKEIRVSDNILNLLQKVGFKKSRVVASEDRLDQKICLYADQRVGPYGVVTLADRMTDGYKRFIKSRNNPVVDELDFNNSVNCLKLIESQIFSLSTISPTDVTDQAIESEISSLAQFRV